MKPTYLVPVVVIALAVFFLVTPLAAQESRGSILGRITDASRAPVPGADVRATNIATGVTTSVISNDEGNYLIPYLLPATYRLTVNLPGFKQFVREAIELRVADQLAVNVELQVGEVSESITVSSEPAQLESASASLGQVIDSRRLAELPIREGSPIELVILAPGVVNTTDLRSRKAAFNNGLSQFSTDGAGQYNNEFSIDGVPNTANNRVAYSPPAAAVQELKVQTSTYDASLGHTMGSVVNTVTTSGTNKLHGEAHEWVRNSALDSFNFFDKQVPNAKKKVYQDNRFGFSLGGPIVVPKLYNGTNRSFWFFAFEANPFKSPQSQIRTVPTAKQRQGDLSDLLKLGAQYQIYDPATIRADGTRFRRDPIPGNIILPNRIDPIARKILEFYPLPNTAGTADGRNNFIIPDAVALETYRTYTGRVDHAFSERHRTYFRFSFDFWEEEKNDWYGNISNGIFLNRLNRIAALDDVYTVSPNLILNGRFGYTRQLFPERRRSKGFDLRSLGFSDQLANLVPRENATFPRIAIDNYGGFGEWETGDGHFNTDVYSAAGTASYMHGNHVLRFGPEFRVYRENAGRFPTDYAPQINFTPTWTRGPLDNSPVAPIGQDLASFLLGYVSGGTMARTSAYSEQNTWWGFYLHDDWKLTRRLTVNLGLRYELDNPVTERYDRMVSGFDFGTSLPIEAQVRANYAARPIAQVPADQFRVRGGMLFAATGGREREQWRRDNRNLMPRVGFAYMFDARTVVRGGYGIFFDTLGTNRGDPIQSGYSRSTAITPSLDNGRTFVATFANPFPNGLLQPFGNTLGLMTDVGVGVRYAYDSPRNPYSQRWSLGVQRELPGAIVLEASYVGNRGVALPITRELNAVPRQYLSTSPARDDATNNLLGQAVPNPFFPLLPGTSLAGQNVARSQLLRPFPQFTSIRTTVTAGSSWYHALQTRLERRMSQGLTLQGAYTWSKAMEATGYLNDTDVLPERVISAFDRTHIFVASGIYELPFGRGRPWGASWPGALDHALGGWQVNAIVRKQTGAPLGFGNAILVSNLKSVVLDDDERKPERWFNTTAFERSTARQLVSNVRTLPSRFSGIRGPGYILWDLSALKNVDISERVRLQLRIESYNAWNHPNFRDPNTAPTNSGFGRITAQNGLPRQFQLAAKLMF